MLLADQNAGELAVRSAHRLRPMAAGKGEGNAARTRPTVRQALLRRESFAFLRLLPGMVNPLADS